MTEPNSTNGRFHFKWIIPQIVHPHQTFEHVLLRKATWYTPMLLISLLLVTQALIIEFRNPPANELMPPEGFPAEEFPSSGMEGEGMSGGEGSEGMPVDSGSSAGRLEKFMPAFTRLAGLWFGWFILTLILFVALVISGSQGNFTSALNLTAWSSLPFAVQIIAQTILSIIYPPTTTLPQGMAGLALDIQGTGGQYLGIVLQRLDAFFIWQVVLLMIGAAFISQLPAGKVRWLVLLAIVVYVVLAALPTFGMEQFSLLQSAAQPKY